MTWEEFERQFPIPLNDQQKEAVKSVEGPVLLLAVPGSGKTTVLVARLGYMIHVCGIEPERILTITYTVAATRDMAARFASFFGDELAARLEFRTINGICAKIIAWYGARQGKKAFALVTDEKRLSAILGAIYQKIQGGYASESDLKDLRTQITFIKNRMLKDEEIKKLDEKAGYPLSQMYEEYQKTLRKQGLMDYDDQMVYALNILKRSPETLEFFQDRYRYLCVDEAQDTSRIQHVIAALLAAKNDNLFMVGDEDQSIYGFRAAYPEALLSFEKNHPGAKVRLMEENFRSNARIVWAADRFIQKNTKRHEKHMRASRPAGNVVRYQELKGRRAQYTYLAKVAEKCDVQTAVLYRDNESAVPLVDLLERKGIPYRLRNGDITFFTHRVVQDITSILRFATEPRNAELFMQIYYKLSTYIPKKAAEKAVEYSQRYGVPLLDAAIDCGYLPSGSIRFTKGIRTHFQNMLGETAAQAIDRITEYMGYKEYLNRSGMDARKLFVLRTIAGREETAGSFLERLETLRTIFQKKENDPSCRFILSTIHASKGLEYDRVYLMDVKDGLFPEKVPGIADSEEDRETYEEERRLFYVGVTRAKNDLCLFSLPEESTFIREFFAGLHEQDGSAGFAGTVTTQKESRSDQPYAGGTRNTLSGRKNGKTTNLSWQEYARTNDNPYTDRQVSQKATRELNKQTDAGFAKFQNSLAEGLVVEHKECGTGVIVMLNDRLAAIEFDGVRKVLDLRWLYEKGLLVPKA